MSESTAVEFWEQRYGERDRIWSGRPNDALVAQAGDLPPGRALDLGCGEGGDTVWLAERGWQVTAVDLSATALDRARQAAAERGIPAASIIWVATDLSTWQPTESYDLVSACFLLSPVEFPRTDVLRRAADAVAPGGHLLVVSHAAFPPWSVDHEGADHHDHHDIHLPSPEEELADLALDPDRWETLVCTTAPRAATGPDGQAATLDDSVVLLRRH